MYRIDIMTLFPDTVGDALSESILGRAQERDILRIDTHQIRDYTLNKQRHGDQRFRQCSFQPLEPDDLRSQCNGYRFRRTLCQR